jgi:hypothetical protein
MQSDATAVEEYLTAVPPARQHAVREVLDVVRRNLPEGYEEVMAWGMITWQVPLATYPDTYNGRPLVFAALANQKRYVSLYLNCVYASPTLKTRLEEAAAAEGRTLRMGRSCVNFTSADELPLEAIGDIIRDSDVDAYVATAKAVRAAR